MIEVQHYTESLGDLWDNYVLKHTDSNLYHLSRWKQVIERTYGHKTYYLMAIAQADSSHLIDDRKENTASSYSYSIQNSHDLNQASPKGYDPAGSTNTAVCGILPLVHLKHFLFGNQLISIPFFDMGGVLADNEDAEQSLLSEAVNIGKKLKVDTIELRHQNPCAVITNTRFTNSIHLTNTKPPSSPEGAVAVGPTNTTDSISPITCATKSHKVRMLLELPESAEMLMKSFKSKLRSQIKKPIKEGLCAIVGGIELVGDFYNVFSVNMRDLGSPVHAKSIIEAVLNQFVDTARIVMVYMDKDPVAGSVVVGFKETLENPWASAMRKYSCLSPNMLLYWTMMEYACENGYRFFDFGRSTPGEGTYKFKKQWGAEPEELNWQLIALNRQLPKTTSDDKSKFGKAISYWQKLPVPVTKMLGPRIRKHIGL